MRKDLLKTKNPVVVYLLHFFTFFFYIFDWGSYIAENLNIINKSEFIYSSLFKKIVPLIFIIFISIFLFFTFISPLSNAQMSNSIRIFNNFLFTFMIVIVFSWNIGIIVFFCIVNYQLDKIAINQYDKKAFPILSVLFTICLFPLAFLIIPFTQFRLNRIICYFIEKEGIINLDKYNKYKNGEETKGKGRTRISVFKICIAALIVYVIFNLFSIISGLFKSDKLIKDLKPNSERFLKLLSSNKLDLLYDEYIINKTINQDSIIFRFEELNNTFRQIASYKYHSNSTSSYKSKLTGFCLYYAIEFDNGSICQGIFAFHINRELNIPCKDKIEIFRISGEEIGERDFYLELM